MKPALTALVCVLIAAFQASAQTPQALQHQGRITVDGVNFDGTGQFRFQLYHSASNGTVTTPLWNNDDSAPASDATPLAAVSVPATKGLYSAALGGAGQQAITANLVPPTGMSLFLRIWFDDGIRGVQQLSPDREIAAVPFARHAETETASGDLAISGDFKYAPARTFTKYIPATACGREGRTFFAASASLGSPNPQTISLNKGIFDRYGVALYAGSDVGTTILVPVQLPVGSTLEKVIIVGDGGAANSPTDVTLNRAQFAGGVLSDTDIDLSRTAPSTSNSVTYEPQSGTVITIEGDSFYNLRCVFYYAAIRGVILEYTTDLITP